MRMDMSISGKVRPDIESVLSSVLFNVITLNVFPPNLNVFLNYDVQLHVRLNTSVHLSIHTRLNFSFLLGFEHGSKCGVVTFGSFYFKYTIAAHFIARAIPSLDSPPSYSLFSILLAHCLVSSTSAPSSSRRCLECSLHQSSYWSNVERIHPFSHVETPICHLSSLVIHKTSCFSARYYLLDNLLSGSLPLHLEQSYIARCVCLSEYLSTIAYCLLRNFVSKTGCGRFRASEDITSPNN